MALITVIIYPLGQVAPPVSTGVLLVATYWGLWLGIFTSGVSAAAFNFFHLPPEGRFTIADASAEPTSPGCLRRYRGRSSC